jgi:glucosamine--fructose-6-phosphate aminotransferase (isomerizing)
MALVQAGFPVFMLAQADATRPDNEALAADFAARGASVMAAGLPHVGSVLPLPAVSGHAALEPILLIQSFYRLTAELSVARGLDPDQPPYLKKVTETV